MDDEIQILQLHYFLKGDDNHSMNALIHNDCERYFIQYILSINKYFDGCISVEIYAAEETGGIKNKYKIYIDKSFKTIERVASIVAILTYFGIKFTNSNQNIPAESLTRIEVVEKIKSIMDSDKPFTEEEFEYIASNDKDLRRLKSEFFKNALKDESIDGIEINSILPGSKEPRLLGRINYADFSKCVLSKEEEIDVEDLSVKIYIVAPVLIKGRKDYWKGICDGESIDFKVSDNEFLLSVYKHTVSFGAGTFIICKMRVTKYINQKDSSPKINRNVYEVNDVGDDSNMSLFKIVHKNKRNVSIDQSSPSLFDDSYFQNE